MRKRLLMSSDPDYQQLRLCKGWIYQRSVACVSCLLFCFPSGDRQLRVMVSDAYHLVYLRWLLGALQLPLGD